MKRVIAHSLVLAGSLLCVACGARTQLSEYAFLTGGDAVTSLPLDARPGDTLLDVDALTEGGDADLRDGPASSDANFEAEASAPCGWEAFDTRPVPVPPESPSVCGSRVESLANSIWFDVDDVHLYWLSEMGSHQVLRRRPTADCNAPAEDLAAIPLPDGAYAGFLRVGSQYVYWTPARCQTTGKALLRTRKDTGKTQAFPTDSTRCPLQFDLDRWQRPYAATSQSATAEPSEFVTYPESGCSSRTLAISPYSYEFDLPEDRMVAAIDGNIYACRLGHLMRVGTDGSGLIELGACGQTVAADDYRVYTYATQYDLVAYSMQNGSVENIARLYVGAPVAVNDGYLYTSDGPSADLWLVRRPVAGGAFEKIAALPDAIWADHLHFDTHWIYWHALGEIRRTRKPT